MRQRINPILSGIDRSLDGPGLTFPGVPEVDLVGTLERRAVRGEEHLDARPVGIGGVFLDHHSDLAGVEADEIADREDADELREATHQVLIELLTIVFLQYGENA